MPLLVSTVLVLVSLRLSYCPGGLPVVASRQPHSLPTSPYVPGKSKLQPDNGVHAHSPYSPLCLRETWGVSHMAVARKNPFPQGST